MGIPGFIAPMLATLGSPFDSDEHLYEIKWDGIRALAFVEAGQYRLRSRRDNDLQPRYPEIGYLASLSEGLILDGELVVLRDDRADFPSILKREQVRTAERAAQLARSLPVTYMVFDVLYRNGHKLTGQPLDARRAHLEEIVDACGDPRLVLSDGLVGGGSAYYDQVCKLGFEGVVAKRLESTYRSGKRSEAWIKMKPRERIQCAIIGWVPDGNDVKSLIIASLDEGSLQCVGRVGSGLSEATREQLRGLLGASPRAQPIVECNLKGRWVEPGLYCTVSYAERTASGTLRAPVFHDLILEDE